MADKKTFWVGGTPPNRIMADKLNQCFGLNSMTLAYNADGTIHTITDSVTGTVYTLSYNADETINTISDTDNTWTLSYNTDGTISGVTKT